MEEIFLKPIETLTQVDKIEKTLQDYLEKSNLQPGDSLPKETELAKSLGVSRTAIREALSRFRTLGIIESRKNRGMIIVSPSLFVNMEKIMTPKLLTEKTLKDIFELRLILEIGISEILFKRKTPESIKELEAIVNKEEHSANMAEFVKYEVDFHSTLYKISGNDTLLQFQKMLIPLFNHVYREYHLGPAVPPKNEGITHRDLLNTLKKGTPDTFRKKMISHLSSYLNAIH
ncbi:FadR/GntR family transcriptional regulator [Niabella aurantiaca]|uniref:FadR/GntR family transcriptional regulator n=1 Tax=Niabella aurantiaca TaxID=379900 RepID=UPI000370EFE3|nr:FCD domain-containing protein [Niabella aurantiaca]